MISYALWRPIPIEAKPISHCLAFTAVWSAPIRLQKSSQFMRS